MNSGIFGVGRMAAIGTCGPEQSSTETRPRPDWSRAGPERNGSEPLRPCRRVESSRCPSPPHSRRFSTRLVVLLRHSTPPVRCPVSCNFATASLTRLGCGRLIFAESRVAGLGGGFGGDFSASSGRARGRLGGHLDPPPPLRPLQTHLLI